VLSISRKDAALGIGVVAACLVCCAPLALVLFGAVTAMLGGLLTQHAGVAIALLLATILLGGAITVWRWRRQHQPALIELSLRSQPKESVDARGRARPDALRSRRPG
jgi:hypothetical protein